jgi:hypothetical protein
MFGGDNYEKRKILMIVVYSVVFAIIVYQVVSLGSILTNPFRHEGERN